MSRSLIIALALWMAAQPAWANLDELTQEISSSLQEDERVPEPRDWRILVSVGYQNQFQKSVDASSYDSGGQQVFTYGFQKQSFQYALSYFSSESSSATGNFYVESERQTLQVEGYYLSKPWGKWTPLMGISLGGYKDDVFTRFGDQTVSSSGEVLAVGGVAGGIQFRFLKVGYTDLVVKALKRESSIDVEWASAATLGLRL